MLHILGIRAVRHFSAYRMIVRQTLQLERSSLGCSLTPITFHVGYFVETRKSNYSLLAGADTSAPLAFGPSILWYTGRLPAASPRIKCNQRWLGRVELAHL